MRAVFAFFVAFGLVTCAFAAEILGPQATLPQLPLIILEELAAFRNKIEISGCQVCRTRNHAPNKCLYFLLKCSRVIPVARPMLLIVTVASHS